nr:hypothetical protein [Thermoleophilum album]
MLDGVGDRHVGEARELDERVEAVAIKLALVAGEDAENGTYARPCRERRERQCGEHPRSEREATLCRTDPRLARTRHTREETGIDRRAAVALYAQPAGSGDLRRAHTWLETQNESRVGPRDLPRLVGQAVQHLVGIERRGDLLARPLEQQLAPRAATLELEQLSPFERKRREVGQHLGVTQVGRRERRLVEAQRHEDAKAVADRTMDRDH